MKRVLLFISILCISLSASSQLLWKISGNGLEKPSYIFGTHHLAPISIKDSIAGFDKALNETEQLFGEIVMEEMMMPGNLTLMQQEMILPGDTTLSSLYTKAQYDSINAVTTKFLGMDLGMLDKLKPATINAQIAVVLASHAVENYNPQEQLDTWFQDNARNQGKFVGGLETIEKQIYILYGSQTLERQAEVLYISIKDMDNVIRQTQEMYNAYMRQDLDALNDVIEEEKEGGAGYSQDEENILIYDRNKDWAEKLPSIMTEKPTLIVVGSAHLIGEKGVLNLLKEKGYQIEPVK